MTETALGMFLRSRRLDLKLSQKEVGKFIGYTQTAYSQLETGKTKSLGTGQAERLALALGCQPDFLMELSSKRPEPRPQTILGEMIVARLAELRMSRTELARQMGTSHTTVNHLLKSDGQLQHKTIISLTSALGWDPVKVQEIGDRMYRKNRAGSVAGTIGQKIRKARLKSRMTLKEVAREMGTTVQNLSRIEVGGTSLKCGHRTLRRLTEVLGMDYEEIEPLIPPMKPKPVRKADDKPAHSNC